MFPNNFRLSWARFPAVIDHGKDAAIQTEIESLDHGFPQILRVANPKRARSVGNLPARLTEVSAQSFRRATLGEPDTW
jgi:hypothetical protein